MTIRLPATEALKIAYFAALQEGDAEAVRGLLAKNKSLPSCKLRGDWAYPEEYELDAYKFLGAYIGSLTGLQCALLQGSEELAMDILDTTLSTDIDITYGDGNTALHLAAFLGHHSLVQGLLERGARPTLKNGKGFTPLDVTQDPALIALLQDHSSSPR